MSQHHEKPNLPCVPELTEKLRRNARKLTGARESILRALQNERHPISVQELHRRLPAGRCDLATTYRSMRLLEAIGMVKRFDLGDGIARFELLGEGDDGHHHHLVCLRCTEVIEIEGCSIHGLEQQIAETNGFTRMSHKLEFFGVCPACQRRE